MDECNRFGISERDLAARISQQSGIKITYAPIQAWRKQEVNDLSLKSRRALASYRGWTVVQLQVWLDGEPITPTAVDRWPTIEAIEAFIHQAPASVVARLSCAASERLRVLIAEDAKVKEANSRLLQEKQEENQVADSPIASIIQQWQHSCNIPDAKAEAYAGNTTLSIETFQAIKQGLHTPSAAELKELSRFVRKPDGAHFSVEELSEITGILLH